MGAVPRVQSPWENIAPFMTRHSRPLGTREAALVGPRNGNVRPAPIRNHEVRGGATWLVASFLLSVIAGLFPLPTRAAFTELGSSLSLVGPHSMSYAGGWVDADGDGTHDLYAGNHWRGPADFYRCLPNGTFEEDDEQYGTGNSDRHDQIWGDFDNDGAPDQYISHGAGYPGTQANELFWNRGNSQFLEGAGPAGVQDEFGRGREITLADFDDDGWLDIYICNDFRAGFPKPNRLYFNNSDGTFTQHPNVDNVFVTRIHCAAADYDGDGLPDLAVSTPQFQNGELYRNLGGGSFVDVTASAFPGIPLPLKQAQGLSWADYDDDGDVDLLACGGNFPFWDYAALEGDSVRFYVSCDPTESKSIRMVTSADSVTIYGAKSDFQALNCFYGGAGAGSSTFPLKLSLAEVSDVPPAILGNAEGIFVWSKPAGADSDSLYLVIRGGPSAIVEIGGDIRTNAPGIISWTKDSFDPKPPFATADWKNRLFRNEGNGTFAEVTATAFDVNPSDVCASGAAWGDYDNDGDLDVYVANQGTVETKNQADYLYRNNDDGTFTEVGAVEGVQGSTEGMTDGGAFGDYNGDGALDLFVYHGAEYPPFAVGPREMFRNEGNSNHWMILELQGIVSNGSGIGARLRFVSPSGVQYRHVLGESDNGYSNFNGVHVGFGGDAVCDTLTVEWPSGQVDTHLGVAADTKWFAIEGEGLRPLANPQLVLGTTAHADTVAQGVLAGFTIPLSNSGGAAAHYSTAVSECSGAPAPWLTVTHAAGALWPGTAPIADVSIDTSGLPFGPHCARIVYTSNSAASPDTVNIDLLVVDPASTGVGDRPLPTEFAVSPPRPNPARGVSRVELALPRSASVEVTVFDVAGHLVRRLAEGVYPAGYHALTWDRQDSRGRRVGPGAYFVRAKAGTAAGVQKLIVLD